MTWTFTVTDEQEKKIAEWEKSLAPQICRIQGLSLEEGPYYGAIGGGLTYLFTPTGIGLALTVKETITGEEINVTNYEDW